MGVILVFEPACDAHWMKDVVQFPNAISQMKNSTNATLITRPNHKQKELEKHIHIQYLGGAIQENFLNFEYSDFSKIITNNGWYLNACRKAANLGDTLMLYPWYGDPFKGAKIFKIQRWLRWKKAFVILKTDGLLSEKSKQKARLREKIKDYFKYIFFDKIVCENYEVFVWTFHLTDHLFLRLRKLFSI